MASNKPFSLKELLGYKTVAIQCHDNPDADSIASAFGIFCWLKKNSASAKIIYSGRSIISKVNLLELIQNLKIPIEYVNELSPSDALVTVDCQYGSGNVAKFDAGKIFVIDHHKPQSEITSGVINFHLASCSTLVWDLLCREGFDFKDCMEAATALYYGLFSDSGWFSEISHPLDKDMRDSLYYDRSLIKKLQYTNLTLEELSIAGAALTRYKNDVLRRCAIFKADMCDPNILGFIADLALQVNSIDVCVIYSIMTDGVKFSVRSCVREVMASEFAEFISRGAGCAGGHSDKAGGFLSISGLGDSCVESFFDVRTSNYFNSFDILDAATGLDMSRMKPYYKKREPLGFVYTLDHFKEGTPIVIRTLEGDTEAIADRNSYFIIGISGEAYTISKEKFNQRCRPEIGQYTGDFEYRPTARSKTDGSIVHLMDYARRCTLSKEMRVLAMQLAKSAKVFTKAYPEGYLTGCPGDYVVFRSEEEDILVVREKVFKAGYKEALD
ncbi:MAG: DHH family phosphoesterase [Clostridiales bacterium]|nr:DHH family phosphoesterase [Clostridiales bacterium]